MIAGQGKSRPARKLDRLEKKYDRQSKIVVDAIRAPMAGAKAVKAPIVPTP